MQTFRSAVWVAGASLLIVLAACEVDEPISARSNYVDSGKSSSSGGNNSSGTSGGVSSGSGGSNGGDDSNGGSVSNGGAGIASAGSAGSAGSSNLDASSGASGSADVVEAGGPALPEASTCAGFALQFTGGGDYASVTRVVQDDFTLEAWLKTSQTSLTGNNFWEGSGLMYADVPMNVDDFGSSMLNGHFAMGVGNPDTTVQGTSAINTGQWVHIATTRQKSTGTIQIIVNGILETSTTVAAQTRSLTAPTMITLGGNTVDGRYLAGTMDEIRMWSIVRTPADILSTMHKTLTGNEAGLVGYWKFDEGAGSTSADKTTAKAGGDANVIGFPQWVPSDAPVCP